MSDRYVVDTSVLIQGFVRDTQTARVRTLLSGALATVNPTVLHVPEFCLVECANVLWKRVRFFGARADHIKGVLNNLAAFPLTVHTSAELLSRALEIGLVEELAVYDTVHITLAETLICPLITVDEKQAKAAATVGVTLKPITDFPEYVGS